ncbi:hypothetical protein BH23BAC4_BH23BAC4_05490 [soil metagenome]
MTYTDASILSRPALFLALLVAAAALPALSGCAPSNRLQEVSLQGERVAVVAAIPPRPRVQAGSPGEAAIDFYDPIGTVARVGTAAAKYREAREAQARLDSTVQLIDIADRIARRALAETANVLGFLPADDPRDASFILDLRIHDYALVSSSFEGATFFALEGEAVLIDRRTGRDIWRGRLREREVLNATWFGLPAIAGNVVTARQLSRLSAEEMAVGLERLADYTAGQLAYTLRRDYARSRAAYERSRR